MPFRHESLIPGQLTWVSQAECIGIINDYWTRLSKISWFVSGERDTDKSRYFAITVFNNCFIIRALFFWSTKNVKSLSNSLGNPCAIFAQERGFDYAWAEYFLQQNTRQLFAGQVNKMGFRPMKGKEKNTSNDNCNFIAVMQILFFVAILVDVGLFLPWSP